MYIYEMWRLAELGDYLNSKVKMRHGEHYEVCSSVFLDKEEAIDKLVMSQRENKEQDVFYELRVIFLKPTENKSHKEDKMLAERLSLRYHDGQFHALATIKKEELKNIVGKENSRLDSEEKTLKGLYLDLQDAGYMPSDCKCTEIIRKGEISAERKEKEKCWDKYLRWQRSKERNMDNHEPTTFEKATDEERIKAIADYFGSSEKTVQNFFSNHPTVKQFLEIQDIWKTPDRILVMLPVYETKIDISEKTISKLKKGVDEKEEKKLFAEEFVGNLRKNGLWFDRDPSLLSGKMSPWIVECVDIGIPERHFYQISYILQDGTFFNPFNENYYSDKTYEARKIRPVVSCEEEWLIGYFNGKRKTCIENFYIEWANTKDRILLSEKEKEEELG